MRKRLSVVMLALAVLFLGGACGLESNETNEIGLVYSGGPIEDKEYKGTLESGVSNKSTGYGSKTYRYRTDQRSYRGDGKNNGADAGPAGIVSKDGVSMLVDYQLYFKLNRNTDDIKDFDGGTLRKFHENIGVKTRAWTNDGWVEMLRTYFEPQIDRSLEAAALNFTMRELYTSEEVRVAFQNDAVLRIKTAIKEVIGDDYFCGPSYNGPGTNCGDFTMTVGKPNPADPEVVKAIEAEQKNAANVVAQETENQRRLKELEAEQKIVDLYGPQGALLREAIRSGKVSQFIIDNTGRSATTGVQAQ